MRSFFRVILWAAFVGCAAYGLHALDTGHKLQAIGWAYGIIAVMFILLLIRNSEAPPTKHLESNDLRRIEQDLERESRSML